MYRPIGVGSSLAGFINGKLLDWNWKRIAIKNNLPYDRKRLHDLKDFPVEKARLQLALPVLAPGILVMIPYGWALQYRAPLAVPLILQLVMGYSFTSCSNMTQNLVVDLFPGMAATVSANNNLARCLFGAGAAAVISPMLESMGWGWCWVFIGLLCAATYGVLIWEMKSGPKWREKRRLRLQREYEEKKAQQEEGMLQMNSRQKT